jgi:hypothetical protein
LDGSERQLQRIGEKKTLSFSFSSRFLPVVNPKKFFSEIPVISVARRDFFLFRPYGFFGKGGGIRQIRTHIDNKFFLY